MSWTPIGLLAIGFAFESDILLERSVLLVRDLHERKILLEIDQVIKSFPDLVQIYLLALRD